MNKMRSCIQLTLFLLIFRAGAIHAAPSELLEKLEKIAKIDYDTSKESANTLLDDVKSENDVTDNGQREKRFYNYYGYGFPPINPVIYPSYPRRDEYTPYPSEDHFTQIYRRLQDIATVIRQPTASPQAVPQFPLFFPVIYIPQAGCGCTPDQYIPPDNKPPSNRRNDTTDFNVSNRWPDMEDDRQNWGFVVNDTVVDDGQEEDFTRPISFEPIRPIRKMSRPPPAVEHGSSQAGQGQSMNSMTTTTIRPPASSVQNNPPMTSAPPPERPSTCDAAILSCCHQNEVSYDCFIVSGCSTPSPEACEPQTILRVIDRFQRFYGPRNG